MATHAECKKQMDVLVERLNDMGPDVCPDWGGSVQFIIPDLKTGWFLKMAMDGSVESCVEKVDEAAATGVLEMNSDIWVGMMKKTVNTSEMRLQGKLKARKSIEAMLKISPAIL